MRLERVAAVCVVAGLLTSGSSGPAAIAAASGAPSAACSDASPESGEVAHVVAAAQAFARSLDDKQRANLSHPMELQYAIRWSNFPAGIVKRNGVPFGEMNATQTAAANALILAAAGACGAKLFAENRGADVIGQKAIPTVSPALHYISFNGEPSTTRPWMLMISGHHLDYNFVFNGREAGATPLFAGSDPGKYTDAQGVAHDPMARQGRELSAMARSAARYPEAKLPGVFTDLTKSVISFADAGRGPPRPSQWNRAAGGPPPGGGPGGPLSAVPNFGIDAKYPQTYATGSAGRGVSYAKLKPAEQAQVRQAILSYAALPGRQISAPLLRAYLTPEALAQTYVAYSGDPNLVQPNAYVRIDGPRVWIELSVQESLIDPSDTHFHSLWRDKVSDYGGEFKGVAKAS